MMRSPSYAALGALLLLAAPSHARQSSLETIDPTYWNVRGFDYIATYANVHEALGIPTDENPPVPSDVASAPAMWAGYHPGESTGQEVHDQLVRIKAIGANTVRVWLSFHLWAFDHNQMKNKFGAFLTECDDLGLHVIPVLWDNDFNEPDYSSLAGADNYNYTHWIRAPGSSALKLAGYISASSTAPANLPYDFALYVCDMVTVGSTHDSLLLWNVMNEPAFSDQTADPDDHNNPPAMLNNYSHVFVQQTAAVIRLCDSNAKISVSPAIWNGSTEAAAVALDPDIDVLGTHLYGFCAVDIEGLCGNVQTILNQGSPYVYKPILVTEAGDVGGGLNYPDVMNLLSKVSSTYTGNPSHANGVGFCLFQAYIGMPPYHPFDFGNGLLYPPRLDDPSTGAKYARDFTSPTAVATLVALAGQQGVTVVPPTLTPLTSGNPGYVLQYPFTEGTGRPGLDTFFQTSPDFSQAGLVKIEHDELFGLSAYSFAQWGGYLAWTSPISQQDLDDMVNAEKDIEAWWENTGMQNPLAPLTDPALQAELTNWWQIAGSYWSQYETLYP